MPKEKLTGKQENFCLEVFKHGNASEAYRRSYNASRMKESTVNRRAFDLMQNGKIKARLEELRSKAEKKAIITKDQAVAVLASIAVPRGKKDNDRIAAIREINRMMGWHRPTEIQLTTKEVDEAIADEFGRLLARAKDDPAAAAEIFKSLGIRILDEPED